MSWQRLRAQLRQTRNFRLGVPFNLRIFAEGDRTTVLYQKTVPPSASAALYELDVRTARETKVLDATMLSAGDGPVSVEERALRERLRLMTGGISFYHTDPAGRLILVPMSGKLFGFDRATGKTTAIAPGDGPIFSPKLSPDGTHVAFVRANNLYVAPVTGAPAIPVTSGGTDERPNGVAEFIVQEELKRTDGFWWSPDGRSLLFEAVDQGHVERLSIADPFHPDAEPQRPFYPRPGKANATFRFGFVPATGGPVTWIDLDRKSFPCEYVGPVHWSKHGPPILTLLNRLQTELRLVTADPKTGRIDLLLKEQDAAWIGVEASVPRWLPGGQEFLWISDLAGPSRLELRNARRGELVRVLSPDSIEVRRLIGVADNGQTAYFEGGADSTTTEVYAVAMNSGATRTVARLSSGIALCASEFHERYLVTQEAGLDSSNQFVLREWDGPLRLAVPTAAPDPVLPARVTIERTGPDAIRTALIRPSDFDPKRRYPVIESAYGGPGAVMVRASGRAYVTDQLLADALQAVVVRMDTRGTPDRGHDWERAISRRFGSLPVQEHAETLKVLCAEHPELDGDRIGVWGWSYGGYFAAYAVLSRPDVYKVAVAGAPPVDWLDYDTAYTERYLGLPDANADAAAYESGSLLPLLSPGRLTPTPRPMLLIHGTGDDNVFFFNTLKLVDKLERVGWPYEFLPLMGQTHMISDPELDDRRIDRTLAFFRQHLTRGAP